MLRPPLLDACPPGEAQAWQRLIAWASVEAQKAAADTSSSSHTKNALQSLQVQVALAASNLDTVPNVMRTSSSCVVCGPVASGLCTCCASPPKKAMRAARRVRINPLPYVQIVERFDVVDIVGDARDPTNPNFGAMGVSRDLRLSMCAYNHSVEVAVEILARWKQLVAQSKASKLQEIL
jgi:hypothetical protein